jgi:hypothetical protein
MKKKKNARFSKCFAIFVSKRYKTVPYKLVVIFYFKTLKKKNFKILVGLDTQN